MALFGAFKKSPPKAATDPAAAPQPASRPAAPPPKPVIVTEIQPAELIAQAQAGEALKLLDCREPFEWAQVRIPGSLHIPMNDIPARLGELDPEADWVVVCAHGNRSFAVAGYLLQNGLKARSLAGGVTDWWMRGGATESDYRR
jgi:rhodanese-related sulfurtransferase